MTEHLLKLGLTRLSFFAGILLVVLSFAKKVDVSAGQVERASQPSWVLFGLGLTLIAVPLIEAILRRSRGSDDSGRQVHRAITIGSRAATARLGQNKLVVRLGRIEEIAGDAKSLTVLPANEYFNDRCINDARSSLGAFVLAKFPGQAPALEHAINDALKGQSRESVTVAGRPCDSYGLGTVAYLDGPLATQTHLLIAAATTERPGEGLRGDVAALFTIVRAAYQTAREERLEKICSPLMGAGHGGIRPSRALLTLLLAWGELLYAHPDDRLEVTVVVFQRNDSTGPEVHLNEVTSLLSTTLDVCAPDGSSEQLTTAPAKTVAE